MSGSCLETCRSSSESESESESEREKLTLVLIFLEEFVGWEEEEKGDESIINLPWEVVGRKIEETMWGFGLISDEGRSLLSEEKLGFRLKRCK